MVYGLFYPQTATRVPEIYLKWAVSRENLFSEVVTMQESNLPAQLQRLATALEFWI